MLISLNWIRDFVDLPADLDPRELAERFTVTTAEVEGVEHVTCAAGGLIAAGIETVEPCPGTADLFTARLDVGGRHAVSVTQAAGLRPGDRVVYAPPGAILPGTGEIGQRVVAGVSSVGTIVAGEALGLAAVGQRSVRLPPDTLPGSAIDLSVLDDWIIEVDNKSITHRPDLWGHYGIAREMAAIWSRPLKPYPVVPVEDLDSPDLPVVDITIDDPALCPRYSALRLAGVRPQPSPWWMQVRLAHVGLRPIDLLVDLTNYIMVELGQPMHAFDAAGIDRIEVATASPGERFRTLDGVERVMPPGALMIQCRRRSVALAGIMGGADTEITAATTELLLESANFEPATIRRCAAALGHRTEASARFEKSQDPHNTLTAIQRFVHLAGRELPDMRPTSRLSDCFPQPPAPRTVMVDPAFLGRTIGRPVPVEEITAILEPLGFQVRRNGDRLEVQVPSWRATKDVTIEADVIEEVARFVGYGSIEPTLPEVTVRYAQPDPLGRLERRTLQLLCGGMGYAEVHRYVWFDGDWLGVLGYDPGPTLKLRNPAAASMDRLRTTLVPGLLACADLNRHAFDRFELVEIGSAFPPGQTDDPTRIERRRLGLLLVAPGRKAAQEDALLLRLKTDLETWAMQTLQARLRFAPAAACAPWEHPAKTAVVRCGQVDLGRLTAVPAALKRRITEHLAAWSIVTAEIDLSVVVGLPVEVRPLPPLPEHPRTEVDFSVLVDAAVRYADIERTLAGYDHPLLRRLAFADSYEGGSVPAGKRSFTFRAVAGDPTRTLTEQDIQGFREDFIAFLARHGLSLRT